MRYSLAKAIGVEFNYWAMLPFSGFIVVVLWIKVVDSYREFSRKQGEES